MTWSAQSNALSFACAATLLAATTLRGALVAHLTFDNPAHLNADSSSNGNDATIAGSPAAAAGLAGGAAYFDGGSYFIWQGGSSPLVQMLNSSFTVCAWVKTTQTFASDDSPPWGGAGIVWADYPGTPPVGDTIPLALTGSKAAGFANSPTVHSTNSINSGQWIHLAFVRYADAANGYVRLFVNGQLEATDSSNGAAVSDAGQLVVGANVLDARYFIGSIDDLQFHDTALSATEIASVYSSIRWLTLTRTNDQITLSWQVTEDGWVLEHTNALPSVAVASWPQVPPPYQTNGGLISVTFTNSPATGNQFFRLHKP
jgi:hypothetical protein